MNRYLIFISLILSSCGLADKDIVHETPDNWVKSPLLVDECPSFEHKYHYYGESADNEGRYDIPFESSLFSIVPIRGAPEYIRIKFQPQEKKFIFTVNGKSLTYFSYEGLPKDNIDYEMEMTCENGWAVYRRYEDSYVDSTYTKSHRVVKISSGKDGSLLVNVDINSKISYLLFARHKQNINVWFRFKSAE